ncbi:MAG: 7-cyano-7-deazaguanine synthase, partial [Candidatus Omnitrophica bacterium]|nr:7-cyano-7-deazaguanine synthase [Candidatus Omnitrophota bacterium]
MSSVCVLASGGVESGVLLSDALERHERVQPLYIRERLRWEAPEIFHLKRFIRALKSSRLLGLEILELPMTDVYGEHWSTTARRVPDAASPDRAVYRVGRNILFLSKAACFASLRGIALIEIGVLKRNPFPDGHAGFFKRMSAVLSAGLNVPIGIQAPFRRMEKEDVILKGKKLPLELTFSCLNPKGFVHCGECNKCAERKRAFFAAGVR